MKKFEKGCMVIHDGKTPCVDYYKTYQPKAGEEGIFCQHEKEGVAFIAFSGYQGFCQLVSLTVRLSKEELKKHLEQ